MNVDSWFSVPVGYVDVGKIKSQQIKTIVHNWIDHNERMVETSYEENLKNSFRSVRNILEIQDFYFVKDIILSNSKKFLKYLGLKEYTDIVIDNSWINLFESNALETMHHHYGSLFSGVYYVDSEPQSGSLYFEDPINTRSMWYCNYQHHFADKKSTIYYPPQEGRIMFFPSWLIHGVTKNITDSKRISLAFNLNVL